MEHQDPKAGQSSVWALAWSLGFDIAIPLILFALMGRFLDKAFDTGPWLLLCGIVLAIITTTVRIYSRVSVILADIAQENETKGSDKDTAEKV